MKTSIFFFVVYFGYVVSVFGQVIYERTYPNAFPSIKYAIELPDLSTFSLGNNDDCNGLGSRHIEADGNENSDNIFYAEAFSSGIGWIGHDSILIWLENGAQDVGPDSFKVYVWTPTQSTQLISEPVNWPFGQNRRYGAFLYTAERIVYQSNDTLYSRDLLTGETDLRETFTNIVRIVELKKRIVVFAESQSAKLLDQVLDISNSFPVSALPVNIDDVIALDSFLVGKNINQSATISMINAFDDSRLDVDFSGYMDSIEELQVNKGFLFIHGKSGDAQIVLQLNERFEIVKVNTLDIPDIIDSMSLQFYPERVYAWDFEGFAQYQANYRICYPYVDPHPIKFVDIALEKMWVDSVHVYDEHYHLPASVFARGIVRNHSEDTLHFVTLHSIIEPDFWCQSNLVVNHFDNLNIPPGKTDTVKFGLISYELAHGHTMIRTLYIQHGNHHLDSNLLDNSSTLVHFTSNVESTDGYGITVYPNPFHDRIYTSLSAPSKSLQLYDLFGHEVSKGYDLLEGLQSLPTGYYYLRIMSPGNVQLIHLVKSD